MVRALALAAASLAPAGPPDEIPAWRRCETAIDWWHAAQVPDGELLLGELVMQRRLVPWSEEWVGAAIEAAPPVEAWLEEAGRRRAPVLWYVPATEGQHMILPHLLDRYLMVGPLSDPELAALVSRRFVPLKLPAGGELARRFGLVVPEVQEPAFLVLAPDGEELLRLERVLTFQPEWLAAQLEGVLEELGESAAPGAERAEAAAAYARAGTLDGGLALADACLLDGAPAAAAEVLDALAADDARVLLRRARIARRARRGDEALAMLERARAAERADDVADELALEVGLVQLGLRRLDEAEAALEPLFTARARGADEAGFRLASVFWATRRERLAVDVWRRTARAFPESTWGAKSAACAAVGTDGLRGEAPLPRSMERLGWLADEVYAPAADTRWRRAPEDALDVARGAVEFLLETQRSDGAWLGSRWGGDGGETPLEPISEEAGIFANIHTAITALAASALLEWRELAPEEIDDALARAEPYLLRDDLVVRGDAVAWVYADAYRLAYCARRWPDPAARPQRVGAAMRAWIAHLAAQQTETGGPFRHYSYTSTFVTAMVTACLLEARAVGLEVEQAVLERAADVLEAARGGDEGLFGYLVDAPQVNRTPAGAACRQPLCLWVLWRLGRVSRDELEPALDLYLSTWASAIEPGRTSNFHVPALDGTAGYFFFHNFLPATWTARDAPSARARALLLEKLVELPEIDGAFLDAGFSYGKSYGTAAALRALRVLTD